MREVTFRCDCGCQSIKQASNRWWMIFINAEDQWSICEWREDFEIREGVKFAAGQRCAHRLLDQFMSEDSDPKPLEVSPPDLHLWTMLRLEELKAGKIISIEPPSAPKEGVCMDCGKTIESGYTCNDCIPF